MKHWVHSMMDATGRNLGWADLLASDRGDMLRRSIVSSAKSTYSPFWICLTTLDGTGGSPALKVIIFIVPVCDVSPLDSESLEPVCDLSPLDSESLKPVCKASPLDSRSWLEDDPDVTET